MGTMWRHPGRLGAVLYAVLAALVGAMITIVSRLQLAGLRGRSRAVQRLPPGPIIVVANHTSYLDGVLLALVCRRMGRSLRLLATAGVFRAPVLGPIARRLGFIPVERGSTNAAAALDSAIAALQAGEAVGIFPEGRLTRDADRWPERGKTGAIRLALQSGAPIVPVAMVGAHRVLDRRRMFWRFVTSVVLRPRVDTAVGDPIDVRTWGVDPDDPTAIRAATDKLMDALIDLVEELRGEIAPEPSGADPA